MKFEELFREKYRTTLEAARANDIANVVRGFRDLCNLFSDQYHKNNGDSIVTKAKLSLWYDSFNTYANIVERFGVQDRRIQKLFGIIDDDALPSLSDIMSGKIELSPTPSREKNTPASDIKMDGIFAEEKVLPKTADNPSISYYTDDAPIPKSPFVEDEDSRPITEAANKVPPAQSLIGVTNDTNEEEMPVYAPNSLRGFIGQQHIVKQLLKEIAIAKNEGRRHLDNILLFGNPGLGKSTLMSLIAAELGVKFELLDCSQFRNSQQSLKALQNFFVRVAEDNKPVVIALDEIHMLNNELQSSLLTLLNDRVYVSPLDVNGHNKRIPINEFTFIAATTDDDKVLDTIKNRCLRLKFQLVDYTPDELKQIYQNKIKSIGLTATDEAIETCIPRSRGAIRYVNSIVEGLDKALYNDNGMRISTHIDLKVALGYFEEKGIDPMGLEKKDLDILRAIRDDKSGVISADVLAAQVGLDTKKYLSEYERYLIKIGFITISGRGRSLTEKALKYLTGGENEQNKVT